MSKEDKKKLLEKVAKNEHLTIENNNEPTVGERILKVLKQLWEKIAPVVEKLFDALLGVAGKALENEIEKGVADKDLGNVLKDAVSGTVEAVQETELTGDSSNTTDTVVDNQ